MGSEITLGIGNLELDWGKNWGFTNHSALYTPDDVQLVDYVGYDPDDEKLAPIVEHREGYSRPLRRIVPRLEMLGIDLASCEEGYRSLADLSGYDGSAPPMPFETLRDALAVVDVNAISPAYTSDQDFGRFFRRDMVDRLGLSGKLDHDTLWHVSEYIENYSAVMILRLLAENPANLDIPVVWRFADVVENGYAERDQIVRSLTVDEQVLIVTEGSSDVHILRKALQLLRPDTVDFFRFIDMTEGYPFTGTGNLFRFCQGLVKIGVVGKVLVIYDNDTEGVSKLRQTLELPLPSTMKAMSLPVLPSFVDFPCLGPEGQQRADINGRAAAIECYLDLAYKAKAKPVVRWTSFDRILQRYQGELVDKEFYTKMFMKLSSASSEYDFSRLQVLLSNVERNCPKG